MQPARDAFSLKTIISGILLCFPPLQLSAQPHLPDVSAYSAAWLPVYPQVSVNGKVSDGLHQFISHNDQLLVSTPTLEALGIRVPPEPLRQAATPVPPEAADGGAHADWYRLDGIPGLEAKYNAAVQNLTLTAPLAWLNLPTTRIGGRQEQAHEIVGSGWAGVLNYDYEVRRGRNGRTAQGLLAEARLTTPAGYLSHSQLWNRPPSRQGQAAPQTVRLDTYWRTVWAERGLVLTAGDVLTGRPGGTGGTRIGGIKLERTYSVQPWRSTAPLFSYLGESTLPGTVDLYLNGVKQYSRDIAAGKYEVALPPLISGRGMAQVVATDVLGRTVVADMPLYGGSGMLAKGLSEWSVEAGYLRRNYGLRSADYTGTPAGSGTWRYGLSNALTVQLHGEGSRGYSRLDAASAAVLGTLGQLDLSHAQSRLHARSGRRSSAFFSTQRGVWSFGAGWSRSDGGFADLGAVLEPQAHSEGRAAVRTASASLAWSGSRYGAFSLSYLHSKKGQDKADKVGTFNWSRQFGRRTGVFLNAARNFNDRRQNSLHGGISFSFDKGYSATLGGQRDGSGTGSYRVSAGRSSQGLGSPSWSIGWQQEGPHGTGRLNGHINHDTQYGDARGSIYHTEGGADWNAGWRGGLVLMSGSVFATRPVNGSFAVVSTDGVAGVPVSLFNSKVGRTDRKGLLLVPNLSAYQKNTLDIDIADLPPDIHAESVRVQAVPEERSGVGVGFTLKRMRGASMTLKNGGGQFVPAGSTVRREGGEAVAVVGFDGQTFIENLEAGTNRFSAVLPDNGGECRFDADYRGEHGGVLPDLGEILCEGEVQ